MAHNPTSYGSMINSLGQKIEFYEHPTKGDTSYVICVSHELQRAEDSVFYEVDDMVADHGKYEPSFIDGILHIGGYPAN